MAEENLLDLELIKRRAISGVITFTLRTFFIQAFSFFAIFILTVLLDPRVFGIFFLVSAFINFFVYFSDIGLSAALIQKKENPTKEDLKTSFTIQQFIIFSLVIFGLLLSSKVASFYKLDAQGLMLIRVLLVSLILSSLKTIPSINLERRLHFARLVIPQIAENLVFYSIAVILAYKGFGIASFTWAVLARGVVGLISIYILSPYMPRIGINKNSLKELTSFGVPFQINSILALAKDDLLTVFLGKILTLSEVGYVGWAQKWAFTPLRFFMDNVNKVTFPAYSRLQDHKEELQKAIEKSIFFVCFLVYPSVFGIIALASNAVEIIPNYSKWQPALPLLYLFSINAIFSAVSTTFTNTLFAIGKPKIVLKLMVFWTVLTWSLTIPLVTKYSYLGVGIAQVIVAITSVSTIYFVKRDMKLKIAGNIIGPLACSVLMYFAIISIDKLLPKSPISLIIEAVAGAIIYFAISFSIFRRHLLKDSMVIVKSLIGK